MTESRFAGIRAQVRMVRRAALAGAVVVFAALAGLARTSHPGAGTHATSNGTSSNTASTQTGFEDDDSSSSFGFGGGDIGPSSGGSPQVQSGGS
jgi:hypothetical protein